MVDEKIDSRMEQPHLFHNEVYIGLLGAEVDGKHAEQVVPLQPKTLYGSGRVDIGRVVDDPPEQAVIGPQRSKSK